MKPIATRLSGQEVLMCLFAKFQAQMLPQTKHEDLEKLNEKWRESASGEDAHGMANVMERYSIFVRELAPFCLQVNSYKSILGKSQ